MNSPTIPTSLESEIDSVYISAEEASQEIERRWNDVGLRKKIEESLNGDIPEIFRNAPHAFISRHVMSPNFELLNFLDQVGTTTLEPLGLEYLHDKFVTKNEDKYYLGKMYFYEGIGKHGGRKVTPIKIIDFDRWDGRKIDEIETIQFESFIDVHHKLTDDYLPKTNRVDMSEFYRRNGGNARRYYQYILSLYICYGVLFENFLTNDFYRDLTENIFLPTYKEIIRKFGVKPLIVPLVPRLNEEDEYWRYYPASLRTKLSDILQR